MSEQQRCISSYGLGKQFYFTGGFKEFQVGEACYSVRAVVKILALSVSNDEELNAKGLA